MDTISKLVKYQTIAQQKGGVLLSTSITGKKLKWKCNEGHIFWLTTYKVHRRGQWCKQCGSSIGERNIRAILKEFGISFIQQYQIKMVPRRKYDFYFEYNGRKFVIEFDGEQHFSYVRKYHKTKAKFNESQIIDRIKTYAAWNSNITIIRIDYTQIENIKYHLINGINSPNVVYFSNLELYKYITDINITPNQMSKYINTVI
jgi:very-short-patch-repair endonuclease